MLIYYLMFALPLAGALSPIRLTPGIRKIPWLGLAIATIIAIGFRYRIGGDWANYFEAYLRISQDGIVPALNSRSVGYGLVNWVSSQLGFGFAGVNTICAVMFVAGLAYFCSKQVLPYLAWLVATPYLVIVVSMGYTAQGVALGMVMVAYQLLADRRVVMFLVFVCIATAFHKSALVVVLFIVTLFDKPQLIRIFNKPWSKLFSQVEWLALFAIAVVIVAALVTQFSSLLHLVEYYIVRNQWESGGGRYRVLMSAATALVFLYVVRQWDIDYPGRKLWVAISILSFVCVPLVLWQSTVIDRISLYFIPLQLHLWSRMPSIVKDPVWRGFTILAICLVYAAVLFIWLNYANHAYAWVPYKNYLLF